MYKGKYHFYTDNESKIVAVSTYAGKTVRGVAKCDPRDNFNEESGKELAEARCALKIAKKRHARAQKEMEKASLALQKANARLLKMTNYVSDAYDAKEAAERHLDEIMRGLG